MSRTRTCSKCGGRLQKGLCLLCPMFESGRTPGGTVTQGWPIYSDALGVHPDQVAEATERNKRHGISVSYTPDGRAVLPDPANRRKLMRLERKVDKDSFI